MKYLTEKEQKLLLKVVREIKGKRAERDLMILALGFNAGLRRAELVGLNVGDIRGKDRLYVRPEIAKRAKPRLVPLNKKTRTALKSYLKLKLSWREGLQDEAPLFVSKKGNRLAQRSLNDLFEYWCVRAGLTISFITGKEKARYTPHSMRHSFARRLLERGAALVVVQKLLGHTSLASTGIYLEASYEEQEEAVEAL